MAEPSPNPVEIADQSQSEPLPPPPPTPSLNSDARGGNSAAAPPTADGRRKKPVHHLLGGAKPADVLLWRDKKAAVGVLGGATVIWAFFEVLEYHLLPFLCYALMLVLALLFLWSNAHILIYKGPPHLPNVHVREEPFMQVASAARIEINRAIAILRDIASGRDVKKFIAVVGGLWILSAVGNQPSYCCTRYPLFTRSTRAISTFF
ncbi:reticulon-like protein B2 isoform X2 [Momordica charantia]|uniref:Reticulon-like protein n=1 Tax=Momordica charantia TaxID=3673 RepID=A0A6J1D0D9_MOMCH|nr:reticulon-like protein B2 isoform X2 [Momordica charantia]